MDDQMVELVSTDVLQWFYYIMLRLVAQL